MPKFIRVTEHEEKESYLFNCPGCDCSHQIFVKGYNIGWTFNGDLDKPTCSPSLLVRMGPGKWAGTQADQVCHSFIRDGQIQFLADCTHALAGQTVEIPEFG